ncbi:MAG: hypothetical protein QXU85_07450 [Sulfolobales archaeon]
MGFELSRFLVRRFKRALLSKEGLVVLLAFTLTLGVYGAIFFSLTSTYRRESEARLAAPATLFFREGYVWRISLPLPVEARSAELVGVYLVVDGYNYSTSFVKSRLVSGGFIVFGSLVASIASGVVSVTGFGSVDLVVYVDPDGRLNVLVDDDLDGAMDDSYLIKFVQGLVLSVDLSLDKDEVLSVSRGSDISLGYLDLVLAASSSTSPTVVVTDGSRRYYIPVVEVLKSLKKVVAYVVSVENGSSLVLVLPFGVVRGGEELSLKVVTSKQAFDALISVPVELAGTGKVVVYTR